MNNKQRAEFEKWYKENINKDGPFMGCGKLMRSEHAMFGLMCWQAAIASVVVDIKNLKSASYTSSGVVYISDVAKAIENAGVKHNDE